MMIRTETTTTCALENQLRTPVPYVTPQTHMYGHYREHGAGKIQQLPTKELAGSSIHPKHQTSAVYSNNY